MGPPADGLSGHKIAFAVKESENENIEREETENEEIGKEETKNVKEETDNEETGKRKTENEGGKVKGENEESRKEKKENEETEKAAAPTGPVQRSFESSKIIGSNYLSVPVENNGKILFFCFLGLKPKINSSL